MNETIEQKPIDMDKVHLPEESIMHSHHTHMGAVLGSLILLLALILSGLYLWGASLKDQEARRAAPAIVNNEPETPRSNADVQILQTTSPSDELPAIEADLGSTNLDSLDTDLNQADRELSAATTTAL